MIGRNVRIEVSGLRFLARYDLFGDPATVPERIEALAVEETIEFPADLVRGTDIARHVVGRVESIEPAGPSMTSATVSYAVETAGGELPQLLNVLFGNCSLLPGVRLSGLELPAELLAGFRGPRYGGDGIRELAGVHGRPLLATALKPMGLDAANLAGMARRLVLAGVDIVKDDHGLANQPFAPFEARVEACAEAVAAASEERGGPRALYFPCVNAPADQLAERARFAREAGAAGLLVLPGFSGFDAMRTIAADDSLGLAVMAHPAFLGSFVAQPEGGISHGTLLATFMRLAGADLSIFPGYGGRFGFSEDECRSIAREAASPMGEVGKLLPVVGGGMSVERVGELIEFFGPELVLLVGGNLHRGDLDTNVGRIRDEMSLVMGRRA